jgi:RimJ/RimL family protein N-acetyltransferase
VVTEIRLERWDESGLELLRRQNSPEMMEHLGGPETEEQIVGRQERYMRLDGPGRMLRIFVEPEGEVAGSVGYWERKWQGERTYETGYAILPEFQGRGLAVAALRAVVERAAEEGGHQYIHAFPHVTHTASNAVCERVGFELVGEFEFEYPKGHFAPSNDWRAALTR